MSRMFGFCFILADAVSTAAAFVSSSGAVVVAVLSLLTSLALASTSSAVRSMLWPTYFWDDPELARVALTHKRGARPR